MTVKIAICGSACVGKTTLAKALAPELGADLISEGYDSLFTDRGRYIQPDKRLAEEIFSILEEKHTLENEAENFVADRSPIDLFNLWLSRGFAKYQKETDQLQIKCREYLQHYTQVIFLSWGALPLEQLQQENVVRQRTMNIWVQFHNHSTMIGLAQQWLPTDKLLAVPYAVKTLEDRVVLIQNHISGTN